MDNKQRKRTKKQKEIERIAFYERLKATPKEKLSPIAKYWLEHENDEPVKLNMRYVLR